MQPPHYYPPAIESQRYRNWLLKDLSKYLLNEVIIIVITGNANTNKSSQTDKK